MTPEQFLSQIIDPGLVALAVRGGPPVTDEARRMLLAIALQESGPRLDARYQNSPMSVPGAAKGFWQFESGGGCRGVLEHPRSQQHAYRACDDATVIAEPETVWRAIEGHDLLATAFARLLLYTDPRPLPATQDDAWDCYAKRLWRPGRPHPELWAENWSIASREVERRPWV